MPLRPFCVQLSPHGVNTSISEFASPKSPKRKRDSLCESIDEPLPVTPGKENIVAKISRRLSGRRLSGKRSSPFKRSTSRRSSRFIDSPHAKLMSPTSLLQDDGPRKRARLSIEPTASTSDINDVQMSGFIVKKQRNKRLAQSQKRFFRLRGACLEYFSDEQCVDKSKTLNLLTSSFKQSSTDSKVIEVHPPPGENEQYNLIFDSEAVQTQWFNAITKACEQALHESFNSHKAGSGLTLVRQRDAAAEAVWRKALSDVQALPGNSECADCGAALGNDAWASINLAVFVCIECSGVHRSLGVDISQVRSVALDEWTMAQIGVMRDGGNARVNASLEARVPAGSEKPSGTAPRAEKEAWITRKYVCGTFRARAELEEAAALASANQTTETRNANGKRAAGAVDGEAARHDAKRAAVPPIKLKSITSVRTQHVYDSVSSDNHLQWSDENECTYFRDHFAAHTHHTFLGLAPSADDGRSAQLQVVCSVARQETEFRAILRLVGDAHGNGWATRCIHLPYAVLADVRKPGRMDAVLRSPRNLSRRAAALSAIGSSTSRILSPRKNSAAALAKAENAALDAVAPAARDLFNSLCKAHGLALREVRELPWAPELGSALARYEALQVRRQYKFGVLLSAGTEQSEDELFANQRGSRAYRRFLSFLGHSVDLATFDGYMGGLTKRGDTGERSISSSVGENEVMFHVATMLPHSASDVQQLERKRHLGNDIVVVVFEDTDADGHFTPASVSSHFNHVFVVVRAVARRSPVHFRVVAVHTKNCDALDAFGPTLPDELDSASKEHQQLFGAFLINAERAAHRSVPTFRKNAARANTQLLHEAVGLQK